MKKRSIDTFFFSLVIALSVIGFLLFFSVSLGTLSSTETFFLTVVKQLIAFLIGFGALIFIAKSTLVDYKKLKYASLGIFIVTVGFQLLVFIPGLGVSVNGANRWIDVGLTTLQPSEFLKIGVVIFLAALLATYKKKLTSFQHLIIVMSITIGIAFVLLFVTKDIGTFVVIAIATFCMLLASHAKNSHLILLAGGGFSALLLLIYFFRRYAWDRIMSFGGITQDALGSDFQINQSLYTIGSGEIFGRGFGQSLQKFGYLPEPLNDSIFAIVAEEWGFTGSVIIIIIFTTLILRGLYIASQARDIFGTYLVIGLVVLIGAQSFINIAAMLKLFPLSGMPLLFVSQGGSAVLSVLIICGLVLNVSRTMKPARKKKTRKRKST